VYSVLFVDDEPLILAGLATIIDWAAHDVQPVGAVLDGARALAVVRERRVDILVTDIRMPDMDGLALLREVRRCSPETRVIVVSGYDDFSYVREAAVLGIENYLLKPLDRDELEKTVIAAVARLTDMGASRRMVLESQEVMRNTILLRVLFGTIDSETLAEKAEVLKLPPMKPCNAVAMILPVEETSRFAERLPAVAWASILADIAPSGSLHPVVPPRADRLILLLNGLPAAEAGAVVHDAAGHDAMARDALARAMERAERELGLRCRGVLGRRVQTVSEIPDSYQAAEELAHLPGRGLPLEIIEGQGEAVVPAHPLMAQVLRYIGEHLQTGLSLKTIAAEMGKNPAYLGQLFRKEMGCSFNDCLNALRVQKARLLIRATPYRMTEIAYLVGFNDPQYFNRIFKSLTGRTPAEYRSADL
jgi:two-component system, response regulator YesN